MAVRESSGVWLYDTTDHNTDSWLLTQDVASNLLFSPDSQTLAIGVENRTILWDVATRVKRAALDCGERVRWTELGIYFSPDGTMFATTHDDGTIVLWAVK